jgi:hypothetical protein
VARPARLKFGWGARKGRRARGWAATHTGLLSLGCLVLVSTALRAWTGQKVPTPWIAPDEMVYGLLGQGLYRTGHLAILGGPTSFYSFVVPALVGIPLSLHDLALGYSILKGLQALVMSLAAVPVYLWGRRLVSQRYALLVAALTLALPGLAYSALVMSDVVFYPVLMLAAWAMAAALESPTRRRQALLMLALGLAVATRLQAVALVPAFLTAFAVDALLARSWRRIASFTPTLVGIVVVAGAWVAWKLSAGESLLGGYAGAGGSYAFGRAVRFVLYHAADAALLVGVFPLCALLVLLVHGLIRGEPSAAVRAYLAVAFSVTVWFVLEVGVFASRELVHALVAERNLIAIAPILFLGFSVWLSRAPRNDLAASVVGIGVAAALLTLPLGKLVTTYALPHSFSIIPLYHLLLLTSLHTLELVFALGVGAAVVLFALTPRRGRVVLPVLLLAALIAGSVASGREVVSQGRAQKLRLLGPTRRWIDARATGPTVYLYDGQSYWNAVWENVFWNRRIRWVYDLPGYQVPGPLPQKETSVLADGRVLLPGGAAITAPFVVAPVNFTFVGSFVVEAPQYGTDRQGLVLWKADPPLRISTVEYGFQPNGDIYSEGVVNAFNCEGGAFEMTLLIKQAQTIRLFLDNRLAKRVRFPQSQTWHGEVRVPPAQAGSGRTCTLRLVTGGLVGSTRFEFVR